MVFKERLGVELGHVTCGCLLSGGVCAGGLAMYNAAAAAQSGK